MRIAERDFAWSTHDRPVGADRTADWQPVVGDRTLQLESTRPGLRTIGAGVNHRCFVCGQDFDRDVVTRTEAGIVRGKPEYVRAFGREGGGSNGRGGVGERDCCWST